MNAPRQIPSFLSTQEELASWCLSRRNQSGVIQREQGRLRAAAQPEEPAFGLPGLRVEEIRPGLAVVRWRGERYQVGF